MSARALLVGLGALGLLACSGPAPSPSPSPPPASGPCPDATTHVYKPERLQLLAGCQVVTARGVIQAERKEVDGDLHVLLKPDADSLDPLGGHWVNAANSGEELGDLVMEPVCELPVTQVDAASACAGYRNPLVVPAVGSHVAASGYWVSDREHGGWAELHPLTGLVVG
jgi:hypothetical protein